MDDANVQYARLVADVLARGERVLTRNAPALRLFGLRLAFGRTPLVSLRRTAWRNALREMEWFLSGSDNLNDLHPAVRAWWAPWADPAGRVAHNYGAQFRRAAGHGGRVVDQLEALLAGVRDHPFSRRNLVTTWNAADMAAPETPITNCHGTVLQAFVGGDGALHLVTYQRSADVVCGLPHNWVQAWALLLWLASRCGRGVGSLVWLGGDVHAYECHLPLARRVAAASAPPPPGLVYAPSGEDFRADDFSLDGPYCPAVEERAEMVV